ncbi:MAG: aspartate kinase, partial [Bacteroidia bacterium]|nr:aspartate kinase [Bacteroidia bacterium]
SAYLNEIGIKNTWLDVRDIIRTDDDFRNAGIDWDFTKQRVEEIIKPSFEKTKIVMMQGFIGATDENESTTLGREGSDYTAAVFANMLDAENVTIWKDVESIMNADPKQFTDAIPIAELNYKETIEMAYYGAQIIHPKTIKPLQNKNIPLIVKCFIDPTLLGTLIHNNSIQNLPPIIVLKEKQVMLKVTTKDFSFVGDHEVRRLYQLFEALHIKPNLTQIGAINFTCVLDYWPEKIEKLALQASEFLNVEVTKELSLLTIRHYTKEKFEELTKEKTIILRQQTTDTIQVLMK